MERLTSKSFPDVVFLPRVFRKGRLGQYRERAEPRRIELSEALALADKTTRKYVVLHEIGHWFRTTHLPGKLGRGGEEKFAHAFALAVSKPGVLRTTDLATYERLNALLVGGTRRKILGFANQILRKIRS